MAKTNIWLKVGAVISSVSLVAVFIAYRAGTFQASSSESMGSVDPLLRDDFSFRAGFRWNSITGAFDGSLRQDPDQLDRVNALIIDSKGLLDTGSVVLLSYDSRQRVREDLGLDRLDDALPTRLGIHTASEITGHPVDLKLPDLRWSELGVSYFGDGPFSVPADHTLHRVTPTAERRNQTVLMPGSKVIILSSTPNAASGPTGVQSVVNVADLPALFPVEIQQTPEQVSLFADNESGNVVPLGQLLSETKQFQPQVASINDAWISTTSGQMVSMKRLLDTRDLNAVTFADYSDAYSESATSPQRSEIMKKPFFDIIGGSSQSRDFGREFFQNSTTQTGTAAVPPAEGIFTIHASSRGEVMSGSKSIVITPASQFIQTVTVDSPK